jgi:hypothetical protein
VGGLLACRWRRFAGWRAKWNEAPPCMRCRGLTRTLHHKPHRLPGAAVPQSPPPTHHGPREAPVTRPSRARSHPQATPGVAPRSTRNLPQRPGIFSGESSSTARPHHRTRGQPQQNQDSLASTASSTQLRQLSPGHHHLSTAIHPAIHSSAHSLIRARAGQACRPPTQACRLPGDKPPWTPSGSQSALGACQPPAIWRQWSIHRTGDAVLAVYQG